MPYFRTNAESWDSFNDVFDPMITTSEVILLPTSLLTAGYIRHDDREVNTAILAAEAYADSLVVNLVDGGRHRDDPGQQAGEIDGDEFVAGYSNSARAPPAACCARVAASALARRSSSR